MSRIEGGMSDTRGGAPESREEQDELASSSRINADQADQRGLKLGALSQKVIGVFYDVYNELGCGFVESVYVRALAFALEDERLRVEREAQIEVWFRGRQVGHFKADLVVEGCLILETKTARALEEAHEKQLTNYLRATPIEVGLVLNFGAKPSFKRSVFSNEWKKIRVNPLDPRLSAMKMPTHPPKEVESQPQSQLPPHAEAPG